MAKIQRTCNVCGKTFETQECWMKRGRGLFCSRECSSKGRDFVPPMLGKHHTEESKKLMSENRKGLTAGEKHPHFGKHHTEEQKQKQRDKMVLKIQTEEHKQKNREAQLGDKNHFFNKHHAEESKRMVSATKQGISVDDWEGFATPINRYVRNHPRYKKACMDAMKDAGFKDIFTGTKGTRLTPIECHHKIPHNMIMRLNNITTKEAADSCDLLFDKHNLIVMLKSAHDKFHNLYGDDKNIYELTPEQIQELYT